MSRKYMANLKLRRWLIKGPFKSERGGCREEKRIVVGCCCCGDDVKQMFARKDEERRETTLSGEPQGFCVKNDNTKHSHRHNTASDHFSAASILGTA
jgi:hypothetical protein